METDRRCLTPSAQFLLLTTLKSRKFENIVGNIKIAASI